MNNQTLKILIAGILLLLGSAALTIPGSAVLEKIETHLSVWRINYAPEKVYLHHDKPFYRAGEVVWLKAYLVNASNLQHSDKSNILYVDLTNEAGEAVKKLKLNPVQGRAHGDISLPEDLQEGIYRLTAYTNWMRNFGEDTFFEKEIYIWSEQSEQINQESRGTVEPSLPDLQFFPEGGDLVYGLSSQVAFKAIGPDGRGVPVSGGIFDDQGLKVADFEHQYLGMGAFTLEPAPSRHYYAKVNFENGETVDYPLPDVKASGQVMAIDETGDQDHILLKIADNTGTDEGLLLTGISQDELKYTEEIQLSGTGEYQTKIPKSDFPTGIARITLSKSTGEPLAERLVFIDHEDYLNVQILSDQDEYYSREAVTLDIEVTDKEGNAVETDLSLAVTDDQSLPRSSHGLRLKSYMLLNSDLRGFIESPGYYFDPENENRKEALRTLMMTQGWRRFGWEAMIAGNFPKINHSNERDINIHGNLQRRNGNPVKNGEVILFLKDKYQTFITTPTDENGRFIFEGFHFRDSIDIVVQGTDDRGRKDNVVVNIEDKRFTPEKAPSAYPLPGNLAGMINRDHVVPSIPLFQGMETDIGSLELGELLLDEVVVEGRAEVTEPFRLHREADVTIRREQLPVAPSGNILESLQGRVAGLQITQMGRDRFRAVIRGQGTPLFLLDGMPVDESILQSINQFDISRIEILKSPGNVGIYGGRGAGGVIALYTHRGYPEEIEEPETGDHIIVHRLGGFSKSRQFYSPRYDQNQESSIPDDRTTIYWNPMVRTNAEGKARVTFYTADKSSLYRVIAEGISDTGTPGLKEISLEVY
ncbi:TonB-dependent receptor plug domain-containing protein [Negadavirga shengliensis]|uniref:TonB-dependent receptor plug domain-containing protein n=1 Tax=Negadavirga shengliensis TaxID=1389218 RepID=A0ABV9T731_9BACT